LTRSNALKRSTDAFRRGLEWLRHPRTAGRWRRRDEPKPCQRLFQTAGIAAAVVRRTHAFSGVPSVSENRAVHLRRTGTCRTILFRSKGACMNGPTELLTVADICKKLGVSRAWVIEHSNGRRRPVLPSIKLGKVRRFDPTELEGFIDDCRRIGQTRVRSASGRIQA
jgi:hypothetical protein